MITTRTKTHYIYALCYPDGQAFYIGRTIRPDTRLDEHITESRRRARSAKDKIIAELLATGQKPLLTILESTDDAVIADQRERDYIFETANIVNRQYNQGFRSIRRTKPTRYLLTVEVGKELYEELQAFRQATGICISHEIREALRKRLEQWKKDKSPERGKDENDGRD